jgi:predicted alpha/beta hydrolase family esterase
MTEKIFFLHSAGPQGVHEGSSDLVAWLKKTLGQGYQLIHPEMPNPDAPDYSRSKGTLEKELAWVMDEVIFVGHSLGGSVLLKYLSEERFDKPVAGIFLISAPFWGGDKDWQSEPFKLAKNFPQKLPPLRRLFLYHSKNDPIVPFAHAILYSAKLPEAILRPLNGDDHEFSNGLPELAEDIRALS